MAHKPIICRRCKKEMADKGVGEELSPEKYKSLYCVCIVIESSVFTSRPQPRDLQWYDKFSR